MQNLFKNRGVTIAVVVVAILLAGVAIFTATRLYTNRQAEQAAGPTVAPESRPVVTEESEELTFNVGPTIPPTPTPTSAAVASPSATPGSSFGGLASATPSAAPTLTPTPTEVASPSATAQPELPEAGVATPTLIGIAAGVLLLLLAFMLAI